MVANSLKFLRGKAVFASHEFRNRNAKQGPQRKDLEGPLVTQTRGHFAPQPKRLPGPCPSGPPPRSTKPRALHGQQRDRWDGRRPVSRLPGETEWVDKETHRPAVLWALTPPPRGSVPNPRPSQDRAASDTGGAPAGPAPCPHHWATLALRAEPRADSSSRGASIRTAPAGSGASRGPMESGLRASRPGLPQGAARPAHLAGTLGAAVHHPGLVLGKEPAILPAGGHVPGLGGPADELPEKLVVV